MQTNVRVASFNSVIQRTLAGSSIQQGQITRWYPEACLIEELY